MSSEAALTSMSKEFTPRLYLDDQGVQVNIKTKGTEAYFKYAIKWIDKVELENIEMDENLLKNT